MANNIEVILTGKDAGFTDTLRKAADTLNAKNAEMLNSLGQVGSALNDTATGAKQAGAAVSASASKYSALTEASKQLAAAQLLAKTGSRDISAALKAGEIDAVTARAAQLQLSAAVKSAAADYSGAARAITVGAGDVIGAHTRMSASGMIMMHSVRASADSFAAGLPPMMIFSEQLARLGEAAALSGGGGALGALGAFMAGPWGIVVLGAATVVGTLISKMNLLGGEATSTADNLGKVKFSSYALGDAQNILGNVMDITTGKINAQVPALMALARAQLAVARVKAIADEADQRKAIASSAEKQFRISGGFGGGIVVDRQRPIEGQVASQFQNGAITADQAVKSLEQMQSRGLISPETFAKLAAAYANLGLDQANQKVYADAESMLDGKKVPYLLKPGKETKSPRGRAAPKDPLADADQRFGQELAQIDQQIAQARRAMLVDTDQIAKFETDAVDQAKKRFDIGVEKEIKDKHITAVQGQQLVAEHDILTDLQKQKIAQDAAAQHVRDAADAQISINNHTIEVLRDQASLASTTSDRRKLALDALAIEKDNVRIEAQRTLELYRLHKATQAQADAAQRVLDNLDKDYAVKADVVRQQTQSPLERYLSDNDPRLIREKVQQAEVQELESVRQGIDDAISNALGIRDPFLKSLIDLFIQQVLIDPIARALQSHMGGGGGIGGFLSGIGSLFGGGAGPVASLMPSVESTFAANAAIFAGGGMVTGPGNGTSDSIHARLSNGEFVMTAEAVRRIGVSNLDMLNKGSAPRFASGGFVGGMPLPPLARNDNAGTTVHVTLKASGNPKADRESADQIGRELRRHLNGPVRAR